MSAVTTDTNTGLLSTIGTARDVLNLADAKKTAADAKTYADGTYATYSGMIDEGAGYRTKLAGAIGADYSSLTPEDDVRLTNRAAQIKSSQIGSYDRAGTIAASQGLVKALKGGMGNSTQAIDGQVEIARKMGDLYSGLDEKSWAKAFEEGLALRRLTQDDKRISMTSDQNNWSMLDSLYRTGLNATTGANNTAQTNLAAANRDVSVNTGTAIDSTANLLDTFLRTDTGKKLADTLAAGGSKLLDSVFGRAATTGSSGGAPGLSATINTGGAQAPGGSAYQGPVDYSLSTGHGNQGLESTLPDVWNADGSVNYSLSNGDTGLGLDTGSFNGDVWNTDGSVNYSISDPTGAEIINNDVTVPAGDYSVSSNYGLDTSASFTDNTSFTNPQYSFDNVSWDAWASDEVQDDPIYWN